ncbi:uncharacterized protein LOC129594856 [Paramacrobiotus metropolitanus]|uniref:uncharacterized protein LOC129594856 n=1 Tax=Paramacrobiotus metropolitanus TaxID=2943436 RepID=UPI002445E67B|nr:uncharacterized protein LOC129594856 [Paramacrobiotus metropolitanus]
MVDFLFQQYPIGKHQPIKDKLDFVQSAKQRMIKYIGHPAPDAMMSFNAAEDTFVLYYHESASKNDSDEWATTLGKFFSLAEAAAKESDRSKAFIIVDCELSGQMGPKGSKVNEVAHYRNGQWMYDGFEEDDGEESVPMAKPTIAPVKRQQAQKRGAVELPCPGSSRPGCCSPEIVRSWKCAECQELLEYGFDDHFYCKCGRALADTFTFHCGRKRHGLQYVGFRSNVYYVLTSLIGKLEAFKDINILVLGEKGVGKSTWINGFANYATYTTLDDALREPLYLIPGHSITLDENYGRQVVIMGNSDNEGETPGQSCTQMPKTYVFRKGNNIIRLIDTPGIGDTRGTEQDKKNFQFIMDHLSHYDSLHGICILLKPNNARLTVMFQFCIKELLSHLHRDACENIVFVFTNARSTFYRPGDTYQALYKLVEPPHEMGETRTLNQNKRLMLALTEPLVCVINSIQENIQWWRKKQKFSFSKKTKNA